MSHEDDDTIKKKGNALPTWGNAQTMNINNLVVTNILSSPYFKKDLFNLKTYHEVVDEIYYKVSPRVLHMKMSFLKILTFL